MPKIEPINRNDSTIEAKFTATVGLRSASFHYSSDTISTNEKRIWSEVKAKVDLINKRIICKTPPDNFKYAFFYVTDHREVSTSSPLLIVQ